MPITREGYLPRLVDSRIDRMLKTFGAVCIKGPKGCGKTWASYNHAESVFDLGDSAGNFQNRTLARTEPLLALEGAQPHLIDEWQESIGIWDTVRNEVDKSGTKGQYILTGSSSPPPGSTHHTGESRIGDLTMHTMTLWEMGDSDGKVSLRDLMEGTFKPALGRDVSLTDLVDYCVRGGWPANIGVDRENWGLIPRDILNKNIESAAHLDGKNRVERKFRMLLGSLARNESTLASKKTLRRDMMESDDEDIADNTLTEYLDCLDRLFLLEDQPSFEPNFRSPYRLGKSPKRHLADPSLAVAALGMNRNKLVGDLKLFGFVFESLCYHDLKAYSEANGFGIFHYRDDKGNEIDAVVEDDTGWAGFEIKLGAQEIDDGARNLLRIAKKYEGSVKPKLLCVICGMASAAYRRDDGILVVPITSLKD